MKKHLLVSAVLLLLACRQESLGPINGVLVVYSPELADFIDGGGLEDLHLIIETVDPEEVFSFAYADVSEFEGTLRERRIILFLLSPDDAGVLPDGLTRNDTGISSGRDIWALNQQVFGVVLDPLSSPVLPFGIPDSLLQAYNDQMSAYIYRSFVSTGMTSEARLDSLTELGFTLDVPKSYSTSIWSPGDGFLQYQRQPDDQCVLLFSIRITATNAELTADNAVQAREAMARLFFYDAQADSVDRARVTCRPVTFRGFQGFELTGVWRNPEYLNAGSFTSRVLDAGDVWYILDMEVYNPGYPKEPYLREGWIIMDTFNKE